MISFKIENRISIINYEVNEPLFIIHFVDVTLNQTL